MLCRTFSASLWGIDAQTVTLEVDCSTGLPTFSLVGLPDSALRESRERVGSALKNSGFPLPNRKITVNLAPADLRKEGTAFDLPLAIGILLASEQLEANDLDKTLFAGELALNGEIRRIQGALSIALHARNAGFERLVIPHSQVAEVSAVEGLEIIGLKNLSECIENIQNQNWQSESFQNITSPPHFHELDFSDIKGQEACKRALEIAAAGSHNFLMIGSPGCGKSMSAKRLSSILPPMTRIESIQSTQIHSAAGLLKNNHHLLQIRPFRSPHHTISYASLVGGGTYPKPGEVSLAHNGVLFLDELPEFQKSVLEVLRQPLEDGQVTICRTAQSCTFPARTLLGAAMNPCPCGYRGDPIHPCTCRPSEVQKYLAKISGPLLDRIDIHIQVPPLRFDEMRTERKGECSATIRERVLQAREIQLKRFQNRPNLFFNAHMGSKEIQEFCPITPACEEILSKASQKFGYSARSIDRILKLARTIADLSHCEQINVPHILEALQYRSLDRKSTDSPF